MTDRTAVARVRRYRNRQQRQRDIDRVEVQVPTASVADMKRLGAKLRESLQRANAAKPQMDFVLGTINAPRPKAIDAKTLLHCLTTAAPEKEWQPHIEALFNEVSAEAVHDLVLAKIVSFEDLYRTARTWRVTNGRLVDWIKEMADLRLGNAAA